VTRKGALARAGAWQELDRRENVAFRARGQTRTFPVGRPAACLCAPCWPVRLPGVRPGPRPVRRGGTPIAGLRSLGVCAQWPAMAGGGFAGAPSGPP
jgi:hypothetical protein